MAPFVHISSKDVFDTLKVSAGPSNTTYTIGGGEVQAGSTSDIDILWDQICFIAAEGIIWTHGKIYTEHADTQKISNKTDEISNTPSDDRYPSEKAVHTFVDASVSNVAKAIHGFADDETVKTVKEVYEFAKSVEANAGVTTFAGMRGDITLQNTFADSSYIALFVDADKVMHAKAVGFATSDDLVRFQESAYAYTNIRFNELSTQISDIAYAIDNVTDITYEVELQVTDLTNRVQDLEDNGSWQEQQ